MLLFYFNIILTIALISIFWCIRVAYLPLLKQLSPEQVIATQEKRKMHMTMILFPIMVFELLSSIFLFFLTTQTEAYYYFAAAMLVQIIGIVLFFLLREKSAKEFDKTGEMDAFKKLEKHHLIVTLIWSFRFVLILLSLGVSAN